SRCAESCKRKLEKTGNRNFADVGLSGEPSCGPARASVYFLRLSLIPLTIRRRGRNPTLLLRMVLAFLLLLPAQAYADAELEKGIDRLAAKHGFTPDSPGVAIAILEPGKAPIRKTYGLANLGLRMPITTYTTFELASLSKPLTALLILILIDRGLMSVNDPVRNHIPELPGYQKKKPVLVRDLLNHVSGLPEYLDLDWPDPPDKRKFWKNEDMLGAFAAQRTKFPAKFAPEAKYEYTNSN